MGEKIELKACPNPWCSTTTAPLPAKGVTGWRVVCGCGVKTSPGYFIKAEAITAWNTSAQPHPLPNVWRPIETAPRDGTVFIAREGRLIYECWWHFFDGDEVFAWQNERDDEPAPKEWIALPTVQAEEE